MCNVPIAELRVLQCAHHKVAVSPRRLTCTALTQLLEVMLVCLYQTK